MFSKWELHTYVTEIVARGQLEDEIARTQKLLVGLERFPHPNKGAQKEAVENMTQLFRALLAAIPGSVRGSR